MKLKYIAIFAATFGVAFAGPDRPGFTTPPSWVDIDNNGEIDEEERDAFIQARKDAAGALADQADANGDGVVDDEERQNMIAAMHANVEEKRCELFVAVAGDDEELSLEEFMAVHPVDKLPEAVANRLFGLLDTTGDDGEPDGVVTKEEFLASLRAPEEPDVPADPDDTPAP